MDNSHKIIQAIANQDHRAFQHLYNVFSKRVYNVAISYVKNKTDAEEITQDVFVRIYQKAHEFKGDSKVITWIYRITVNTSLNFLKKRKRTVLLKFGNQKVESPDFEHPGVLLENKEKAKLLFSVIDTLPNSQKTAFILSFVEELPQQEVAKIMEISLKAVESLLQRAKKSLRKKLEKLYPDQRKK